MDKKKSGWKKPLLTVLLLLLAVVLVAMVAGAIYMDRLLRSIPRLEASIVTLSPQEAEQLQQQEETEPEDPAYTGIILNPEDIVWNTIPTPTIGHKDEIINILLIGQDRRPGESRQRSDAMILCTVNVDKKSLTMTSFLRDSYVHFPDGYNDNRLNAAYQFGGFPMLNETLGINYGLHIDGNVEVDFDRFIELVDLLGGVDVTLTEAEAAWINRGGWYLHAGSNRLNGAQALSYSRIRKLDNDFGRTNRQRKVLQSMLDSCRNSSVTTLMNLLKSALPLLATDMTDQQILSYAGKILPILKDLQVTTQYIPAKGTYTSARIRGMSVLVPDLEANRQILQDTILGEE